MIDPPIYLMSDLHILMRSAANKDVQKRLKIVDSAISKDTVVVCVGDVVENGLRQEYERAYELLVPFKGRIVMAIGNHDAGIKGLFHSFFARRRWKRLCKRLDAVSGEFRGYNFLVLETPFSWWSIFKLARGRVTKRMLKRIKRTELETKLPVIICQHHDPKHEDPTMLLEGAERFREVAEGRVRAVLYGHSHQHYKETVEWPDYSLFDANRRYRTTTYQSVEDFRNADLSLGKFYP